MLSWSGVPDISPSRWWTLQRHERQRLAYDFLQSSVDAEFGLADLAGAADWKPGSASTYISKHLKGLVESVGKGRYRVRAEFQRLTFDDYRRLADQTRRRYQTYDRDEYSSIVSYEFLLPLTREDELRRALDDLFYSDSIERSLREAGLEQFEEWFPRDGEESDATFSARIVAYGDRIFGGYSISHMSGRFRSSPLLSRSKAAELLAIDRRYLVDETTALVKFIIPIGASLQETSPDAGAQLQLPAPEAESTHDLTVDEEIRLVRQLFFSLFVEALIRNVAGEDEIWLIEESPAGRRLHVWKPA